MSSASSSIRRWCRPAEAAPVPREISSTARAWKVPTCASARSPVLPALVGPSRRLPYRSAGPGQGTDGQEHCHRAGRREGRFFAKTPPVNGDRDAIFANGVACYKLFIQGLLDITDNIVNNKIVPPVDVVRHDMDDPYLVVPPTRALRPSRPTSPTACHRARLLDGRCVRLRCSVGYDHKGMGITARGAWESVKRHFRALGRDSQARTSPRSASATCPRRVRQRHAAVAPHPPGGCVRSPATSLLDPNPDAATTFVERERLFTVPRSSWADYDAKLISKAAACTRAA